MKHLTLSVLEETGMTNLLNNEGLLAAVTEWVAMIGKLAVTSSVIVMLISGTARTGSCTAVADAVSEAARWEAAADGPDRVRD
jgi:hypothetical protein